MSVARNAMLLYMHCFIKDRCSTAQYSIGSNALCNIAVTCAMYSSVALMHVRIFCMYTTTATQTHTQLYAIGDPSICPATPVDTRSGSRCTGLSYGYADAPGWRISMEDATCHHTPLPGVCSSIASETGLFGVFDGHGKQQQCDHMLCKSA
jgi:hypothetical protein